MFRTYGALLIYNPNLFLPLASLVAVAVAFLVTVRLNPGGVLGKKVAAEKALRRSRVPYAIVRPVGLKDSWPSGRPVFSQGDVAVGRTNPDDLAKVLVGALQEPEATYKTFEVRGLPSE